MLKNSKNLFELDDSITFLNGSYMSPQLKSVTQVGLENLIRKEKPYHIYPNDFYEERTLLKQRFAELVEAGDAQSIAIIPSVSYGMASIANNIELQVGEEIVMAGEQFPSHVYVWQDLARRAKGKVIFVDPPALEKGRAQRWNQKILETISNTTKVVCLAHVHWADGSLFDLKQIRIRAHEVGAKLIIDGTQSVGALPFSINEIQPDALVCAGYKWLMGPYGLGLAYFSESFWDGQPIEFNWLNRYNSQDFKNLTQYQEQFKSGAERFSVGESSNFIHVPMLTRAIEQLLEWKPEQIQLYCQEVVTESIEALRSIGCFIEEMGGRGHHLFGVYLPGSIDMQQLRQRLTDHKIIVSYRGNAIRVSPHVYNTKEDMERFVDCVF